MGKTAKGLAFKIKSTLDWLRPVVNFYHLFLSLPSKKRWLRLLGAQVSDTALISRKVRLWEPAWFQANEGAIVNGIDVKKGALCLIESGTRVENAVVECDTIFTDAGRLTGEEISGRFVTFSIDLEGGVGLAHASRQEFERLRKLWAEEKQSARRLKDLLERYEIPATWAVCGHLFLDNCDGNHAFDEQDWYGNWFKFDPAMDSKRDHEWYMPDLVNELLNNKLFEVGYHSFGHFNYLRCSAETARKDMEFASHLRGKLNIGLSTLVYPYNAVGRLDLVTGGGFKNVRGYIGKYYAAKTIDFGGFRFFATSQFVSPLLIDGCTRRVGKTVGKNFNYFTHPFNWTAEEDFERMEVWLKSLAGLREQGKINIKKMCDVG